MLVLFNLTQRREIQNTFFNLSSGKFDWKQEWTFDEGKTWVIVAKINCKREK